VWCSCSVCSEVVRQLCQAVSVLPLLSVTAVPAGAHGLENDSSVRLVVMFFLGISHLLASKWEMSRSVLSVFFTYCVLSSRKALLSMLSWPQQCTSCLFVVFAEWPGGRCSVAPKQSTTSSSSLQSIFRPPSAQVTSKHTQQYPPVWFEQLKQ
jgi:hypothetical protein